MPIGHRRVAPVDDPGEATVVDVAVIGDKIAVE
jgi:hypothetical protein